MMSVEWVCALPSLFGGLDTGDVSLDQDKDCVSYIYVKENELVLVPSVSPLFFSFFEKNPCTLCQIWGRPRPLI